MEVVDRNRGKISCLGHPGMKLRGKGLARGKEERGASTLGSKESGFFKNLNIMSYNLCTYLGELHYNFKIFRLLNHLKTKKSSLIKGLIF